MRICVKVSSLSFQIKFRMESCGMFEVFEGCRSRMKKIESKRRAVLTVWMCGGGKCCRRKKQR